MKFEEALKSGLQEPPYAERGDSIAKFLYGKKWDHCLSDEKVTDAAKKRIASLGLEGDNFELIGNPDGRLVVGNDKIVFKLESEKNTDADRKQRQKLYDQIPKDLIVQRFHSGNFAGYDFEISERVRTTPEPYLGEVIAFLQDTYAKGLSYENPPVGNFGYDRTGKLVILDEEHFFPAQGKAHLSALLQNAVDDFESTLGLPLPHVYDNGKNTYVVLDTVYNSITDRKDSDYESERKKLSAILKVVGVDKNEVEFIKDTPIAVIASRQVTFPPPQKNESLADYIRNSLTSVRPDDAGKEERGTSPKK